MFIKRSEIMFVEITSMIQRSYGELKRTMKVTENDAH